MTGYGAYRYPSGDEVWGGRWALGQQRRYRGNEQAKDDLYRRYEALQVSEKQVIEPVASGPLNKPVVGGKVLADQVRR